MLYSCRSPLPLITVWPVSSSPRTRNVGSSSTIFCNEKSSFSLAAWVRGYRKAGELSAEDVAEIPTLVMLRRLLLVAWIGSHSETELAQSMGVDYSRGTGPLCEDYLAKFG